MDQLADYALSCIPRAYKDYLKATALSLAPQLDCVIKFRRYTVMLRRKVGEGGAGTVHEATVLSDASGLETSKMRVAVKKVVCADSAAFHSALTERDIMTKNLHPGLMTLLDSRSDTNNSNSARFLYLLMPLYEGSLWDVVHEQPSLTSTQMLSILCQIVEALIALHSHGLVHRDIKPQNILFQRCNDFQRRPLYRAPKVAGMGSSDVQTSSEFKCVITDLGSCCPISTLKVENMSDAARVASASEKACSPLYRPPELYEPPTRGTLDGRIDTWSLGCVLYFMIMRINPFERQCMQGASLLLAVKRARIDWNGSPEQIHPDLKELVNACLRPQPEDRPTSHELKDWICSHEDAIMNSSFA